MYTDTRRDGSQVANPGPQAVGVNAVRLRKQVSQKQRVRTTKVRRARQLRHTGNSQEGVVTTQVEMTTQVGLNRSATQATHDRES